jgi:pimeloyl-ACP methyl ester carboxylesterase
MAFHPSKLDNPHNYEKFEELNIKHDNISINSIYYNNPESDKVILYLHGNAGSIWDRLGRINLAKELHHDLLMIDYAGFGKNEGKPTFQNIVFYSQIAYKYLLEKYKPENIVFWGTSVGTIPATNLATLNSKTKLVLEATLTDVDDMIAVFNSQSIFMEMFVSFDIDKTINYNLYKTIKKVKTPILFIHPEKDEIAPLSNAQKLYETSIVKKKSFYTVKNASHNETMKHPNEYIKTVNLFLNN